MAEKEPEGVACLRCYCQDVRVVSRKNNLRPRLQTGRLETDLTPVSTTVTYKCQNPACGHEWNETTAL
jgi:hypothetical protein